MANAAVGHHPHALTDGVSRVRGDQFLRHDFPDRSVLRRLALQADLPCIVSFGDIPTNSSLSTTGSAPTFLSAISWMASKTIAFGAIDQTAEPFCAKIVPTEPTISIGF